jgi:PAS domain S-box-containing protein/putative nucleotidyltransferase with HDIG domain
MTQRVTKQSAKQSTPLRSAAEREALGKDRREATRDRRQEARNLIELEAQYRALVDQSIAAIYMIQNRRIVYVNARMREIFGYAPRDVFDPNPLAHVKESDRPMVINQMQRRLRDGGEAAYSITALRKDRSEFPFGIHATRAIHKGKPAIIAIAQDITDKVRAEENARRYSDGLKKALQCTIKVLSIMSELRDPYTHGHEQRVGEFAAAIAAEMGLDANRVEGIRVAGYVHDVGKIIVPVEILSKPTRLTPAEFELIKGHAQQSFEILKGIDFPWPVGQIAVQHHERLDGSGYPNGLRGDAIILEARIVTVADVVEAMSSHRPYRAGLGIEQALAEIEHGRGKTYDADVVEACVRLIREKGYKLP